MAHDGFGRQDRLADCMTYADDPKAAIVVDPDDTARAMRFLFCLYELYDIPGLNYMLNLRKFQGGTSVKWLGLRSATALGITWLPRAKALRAAAELRQALAGEMAAAD